MCIFKNAIGILGENLLAPVAHIQASLGLMLHTKEVPERRLFQNLRTIYQLSVEGLKRHSLASGSVLSNRVVFHEIKCVSSLLHQFKMRLEHLHNPRRDAPQAWSIKLRCLVFLVG